MSTQKDSIFKFHQFINVEKGPVNAAIIDLLTGNFFQVPLSIIEKFEAGMYGEIEEFMAVARQEKLIIEVSPNEWIPDIYLAPDPEDEKATTVNIELHIDDGIDIEKVTAAFQTYPVRTIYYYMENTPPRFSGKEKIVLKKKNFHACLENSRVDGNFCKIQETNVRLNMTYNSCWGTAVAVTSDGKIRPCIHSQIEIGSIDDDPFDLTGIIEKLAPYWMFTKDKVERCRDCEFRYVCFDCREIAMRKKGEIDGPNPNCDYNPYTGEWKR